MFRATSADKLKRFRAAWTARGIRSIPSPLARAAKVVLEHDLPALFVANQVDGVSRSALVRAVDTLRDGRDVGKTGAPFRLNAEQRAKLVEFAKNGNDESDSKSNADLHDQVVKLLSGKPQPTLADVETHRISYLTLRRYMLTGGGVPKRPRPVERERIAATTPANMRAYHRSLKRLFDAHQYDSSLVGAFDETMLDYSDEGKAALFVYTFGQSPAAVPGSASLAHITLGATIFCRRLCHATDGNFAAVAVPAGHRARHDPAVLRLGRPRGRLDEQTDLRRLHSQPRHAGVQATRSVR
jgi:hypothetical protein